MPFQVSGRRPAEAGNRRYHVLTTDGGVRGVAAFYGTTPEALYELALRSLQTTWGSFRATAPHTFFDAVIPGRPGVDADPLGRIVVAIPESELGVDLVSIYVTGQDVTLRQICAAHNRMSERAAARMAPLTPHMLWHMVVNAQLREATLAQHPSREATQIDHAPDAVTLPDRSTVMLPYPSQHTSTTIHAVPSARGGDGDTTTTQSVPRWAWTLKWLHLEPIKDLTARLERQFTRARNLSRLGAQATLSLGVIRQVVGRIKDEGGRHATLDTLDAAVLKLQNDAARVLVAEPLRYADPHALDLRLRAATALLDALRAEELATGIYVAFTEPDTEVDHRSIRGQVCSVLIDAFAALGRTTLLGEAVGDAMAALRGYGDGDEPVACDGKTGLQVALSVAGGVGGIITNSTANLPGPASLAGAVLEMVLAAKLPEVALQGERAAGTLAELRRFVMKVGNIGEGEMMQFQRTVAVAMSHDDAAKAVKALGDKVQDRFFASRKWGGFVSVLNLFALYGALTDDGPGVERQIVNIVGGEMNSALAIHQFLASLTSAGGAAGAEAAIVLKGVGTLAAVLAIVSGSLQAYEGYVHGDNALVRSGLMNAVGGTVALAGVAFAIPGLQAIGMITLIVSAAIDNWDAIVEALKNPVGRVFRAQVTSFGEKAMASEVGRAQMASHPLGYAGAADDPWTALLASIQRCQDAIAAADAHLVPLEATARNNAFLTHMGFGADDVARLLEPRRVDPRDLTYGG